MGFVGRLLTGNWDAYWWLAAMMAYIVGMTWSLSTFKVPDRYVGLAIWAFAIPPAIGILCWYGYRPAWRHVLAITGAAACLLLIAAQLPDYGGIPSTVIFTIWIISVLFVQLQAGKS